MRILLVDDNMLMQQVLSRVLGSMGHTVQTAECVGDALDLATKHMFEMLLLDMCLPDGDGAEALELLRRLPGYTGVPALAISGYGDEHARKARVAGFDGYFSKPVDFDKLQAALNSFSTQREQVIGQ